MDDGKIYALRNARWTWEKIRQELGTDVSLQTLINHYEKEKDRREKPKLENMKMDAWTNDPEDQEEDEDID